MTPKNTTLTQARLKELVHYNPDTGIFTWIAIRSNRKKNGDVAGCYPKKKNLYAKMYIDDEQYQMHRLCWLYMTGRFPNQGIDHLNQNKQDNRFENLQESDHAVNSRNMPRRCDNISGATGVTWHNQCKKWLAVINRDGVAHSLGLHVDFRDAVTARKEAEEIYGFSKNHGKRT